MKTMKKIAALLTTAIMAGTITVPFAANAEVAADIGNGWTINYSTSQSEDNYALFTTEEARSGKWSVVAHSPQTMTSETTRITISHAAGLPKGGAWDATGKYTVEFYAKGLTNSDERWGVRAGTFGHQSETSIMGTFVALNGSKVTWGEPDEDGWVKCSFDFAYPYTENSDFKFAIRATPTDHDIYFDDVRVYYTGTNGATYPDLLTPEEGNFEPKPIATGESLADYGWSVDLLKSTADFSAEIVREFDGNKMLHVKYDETGWNQVKLHRTIATPAGAGGIDWDNYRIYFKMKGTYKKSGVEVGNDQTDNRLRFLSKTDYVTTKDLGDGWTQFAVTTDGQNKSGFRMHFYNQADVYLDDFMVVKLNGTTNNATIATGGTEYNGDHLYNGSFDNPTKALDKKADGWYTSKGSVSREDYIATLDTVHAYSGKYAYFISGSGVWVDKLYVDLIQTLPENFDYTKTYTAKMKVYAPSSRIRLKLQFANENNSVKSETYLGDAEATDLGNGWYEYTVPMQATAGYNKFRIITGDKIGGIWVDDVSLKDENGVEYITNGSFDNFKIANFGEFTLMDDGYEPISAPVAGENIASVYIETLEDGVDYTLYFAIYKDGKLYNLVSAQSIDTAIGEQELMAGITLDTVSDGVYTAKAFLWNEGMTPYVKVAEFPTAN